MAYVLCYCDSNGDKVTKTITEQSSLCAQLHKLLAASDDCRVILNSDDSAATAEITKLFQEYEANYVPEPQNIARKAIDEALQSGEIQNLSLWSGGSLIGFSVIEASADALAEYVEELGTLAIEAVSNGLEVTADIVGGTADVVGTIADIGQILGPAAIAIRGVTIAYRVYRKAKKNQKTVIIISFTRPEPLSDQQSSKLPPLRPISASGLE